ncbi:MAG TPA: mechanosensitive ion channel domain-containing protein [Gammaproteobacteria bacterium]|nr:mechanosensitive ion channel domain-containing protein [Gammaproteobacteria bacterium]
MLERLETIQPWLPEAAGMLVLLAAAVVSFYVIRPALTAIFHKAASRTASRWDNALARHKVFGRVTHVIPALVVYFGAGLELESLPELSYPEPLLAVTRNVALAYLALMLTLATSAALAAGNDVYESHPVSRERPLKGIVQVLQIVVFIVGGIILVANLIDESPAILLSGLGAMTAVLLLIFKDTILGLVASLQLTANDMVRVGDWIEMPACGADGDVIDVALHTVKIQNFDKTITTIPTYKLIAESFKNWRGMSEAGGRRIKRPVHIDQSSIRFLTDDEIEGLSRFALLREHCKTKREELEQAAEALGEDASIEVNRRRLTNIGVFRAYVKSYLRHHTEVHRDLTVMVRQLKPGPEGLPIEIYCFTRTTEWLDYEDVQSDIFDHILAILPEFGLRLFQQPTGADLAQLTERAA